MLGQRRILGTTQAQLTEDIGFHRTTIVKLRESNHRKASFGPQPRRSSASMANEQQSYARAMRLLLLQLSQRLFSITRLPTLLLSSSGLPKGNPLLSATGNQRLQDSRTLLP